MLQIYHDGFVPCGLEDIIFVAEEGPMKGKFFDLAEFNQRCPSQWTANNFNIGFPMPLMAIMWASPEAKALLDPDWLGYTEQVLHEGPLRGGYASRADALDHGITNGTFTTPAV